MSEFPPCPKCKEDFVYPGAGLLICSMCFYEWNPEEISEQKKEDLPDPGIKDAHGNILHDGDSVIVIKDLPVKGSSKTVKSGTKIKSIRLTDGDHNISCKIDRFGAMAIKSEFVKKVWFILTARSGTIRLNYAGWHSSLVQHWFS